ncbi:MAG TPA: hypothetical protein VK005_02835 [Acholeplasma sp.]|nr:hypothetical protein [Acholeplasma sp.]
MAKKYQAIETKVHWLTWTAMGLIVAALIAMLIIIQPSEKDVFYSSYFSVTTDADFAKKLPEDNKFQIIKSLENGFLSQGLYEKAANDSQLTIVYFGEPNETSASAIANVYARLYGASRSSIPVPVSDLYTALSDEGVAIYYYEVKLDAVNDLVTSLNEKYEDADMVITTSPFVIAFLNGKVVDYTVVSGENIPRLMMEFYDEVLASDAVQALI